MEETAYLARLFIVHLDNSLAEKSAHRRQRWGDFSYSSLPTPLLPLPKSRDQVVGQHIKSRRAKRLAWWQTLGPFGPGVIPRFLQGHLNDAEETRLG